MHHEHLMYATSNANDCIGDIKYRCCKSNFVIQNKNQTPHIFLSPQRFQIKTVVSCLHRQPEARLP